MELEVDGTTDVAAKQALAERIQTLAAKYWTDGEILSIANGLVNRLGLAPKEGSTALPASKGGPVIFRVPRPGTPNPARADTKVPPNAAQGGDGPTATVPQNEDKAGKVPPSVVPGTRSRPLRRSHRLPHYPPPAFLLWELSPPAVKITPPSPQPQKRRRSHATTVILVATVAVIAVLGIIFFTRKHHGPPIVKTSSAAPAASTAVAPSPNVTASPASAPEIPAPPPTAVEQRAPERSPLPSPIPSDAAAAKTTAEVTVPAESGHNTGHAPCGCRSGRRAEFLSTEDFSRNARKPDSCACRISSSRTTLYKSPRAAFRILPSRRSEFARANPPGLSSTYNRSLAWLLCPSRAVLLRRRFFSIKLSLARFSPTARSPCRPSIPETTPSNCATNDLSRGSSRSTSLPAEPYPSLLRMPRWKPLRAN